MKRAFTLVALGLILALAATTGSAKDKMEAGPKKEMKSPGVDMTATLEANERAVQEAFKNKDLAGFMKLVDERGWHADPSGISAIGTTVPEMIKQVDIKNYSIDSFKTLMIDKDAYVAMYVFLGEATMGGQPYPAGPWYCSTVWAKRGKEWKAIYHQETLAMQPPTPPAGSH